MSSTPADETDTSKDWPIFNARDHASQFEPLKYLEDFYKTAREDGAMQVVLFFTPGILYRLPQRLETALDLGAGPTIYMPIALRNRVNNIWSSDFNEANRCILTDWLRGQSVFDWTNVCEWIASIEASHDSSQLMQDATRSVMRGVLDVDVHATPVVRGVHSAKDSFTATPPETFDLVTTVFCLEYSCEMRKDYERAVHNAASLVKPGGWLVCGGVFEALEYSFGGRRFKCFYLTREQLKDTLQACGFCTTSGSQYHFICQDDIFLLVTQKAT